MNQKVYNGYSSYKKLSSILKSNTPNKIFLIIDKESYSLSSAKRFLNPIINNYQYTTFCDFKLNPKLEDVKTGVQLFKESSSDFILGVGGGSVIDIAKAISVLVFNDDNIADYIKGNKNVKNHKVPTIVIPTTSGTGSEATHFSVVYIDKKKYSFSNSLILPDFVILDPSFTESLPAYITACSGMDAFCQGIESFWSVNSTKESIKYSELAIKLALSNIVKAVNSPDRESRENMLMASHFSGKAINIAKTTVAHSVSYPITSYFDIPHGHAVALTLPYFLEFNSDISLKNLQDKRGLEFVKNRLTELLSLLEVKTVEEAKNQIIDIMKKIKIETSLTKLGIKKSDLETIINNGFNPLRVKNNPRLLTKMELRNILEKIL